MTAAYRGMPRRRPTPEPVVRQPQSLSASERSHRQRLVREARAAVQIVDDPVKRLLTRRGLADELDEPAHYDSVAPEARDAIERLVGKRRRAASVSPPLRPQPDPQPVEVAMPEPDPLPEPPVAREPVLPPSEPMSWAPTAEDIAALARARHAEVAAGTGAFDEATADSAVSDISRLLSRRNGA